MEYTVPRYGEMKNPSVIIFKLYNQLNAGLIFKWISSKRESERYIEVCRNDMYNIDL